MTLPKKTKPAAYLLIGFISTILLVLFDQWTKRLAVIHLKEKPSIPLIPGVLELQYLENRGAAFGMMQNCQWLFVILCVLFVIATLIFYWKMPGTRRMIPLHIVCVLAVSGGIGNAIDRVWHNYVIDFVYFSLIDFPIFNIADCYVVICAILLVILYLFYYKDEDFEFLERKGKKTEAADTKQK